jgi:aryl-alcohol dehydrogenase-like predicted oxidoreductase
MRYRPFGQTGTAVSAVSLALTDMRGWDVRDWTALIHAALEQGINAFEIVGRSPAILEGLAAGLGDLERRLLFVGLRLGVPVNGQRDYSAKALCGVIQATIARTGLEYLDVVLLDDPAEDALSPDALAALKAERTRGSARMIGIAGLDPAIDFYIATGAFDVLAMPFGVMSGWLDRRRIREAVDREMAVMGTAFIPDGLAEQVAEAKPRRGLLGRFKRVNPLDGVGTYAFLDSTPGWTMEEICLAYALTEPSLATMQVASDQVRRLEALASVAERDLPAGLSSRIEMARFSQSGRASQGRGQP